MSADTPCSVRLPASTPNPIAVHRVLVDWKICSIWIPRVVLGQIQIRGEGKSPQIGLRIF
jgi:hypothetical protein